jgi:hypothetical protein
MAMDRAVPAKDYGHVGLIGTFRRANCPISAANVPELCEVLLEIPRAEDGSSAHALRI